MLHWQNWVAITETSLPGNPRVFSVWPFIGIVCTTLCRQLCLSSLSLCPLQEQAAVLRLLGMYIIWSIVWIKEGGGGGGWRGERGRIRRGPAVRQLLSCVRLFAAPCAVTHQAPLSMGFSRQECWSGLPCPPPELGGLKIYFVSGQRQLFKERCVPFKWAEGI